MILTEKEIELHKIIGEPVKFNFKKRKSIGSKAFFLKSIDVKNIDNYKYVKVNSRCNFQKYTNGILMRVNYSNRTNALPIKNDDIIKVELIRGKEEVNPYLFSPMSILLKLNVPIRYARYFSLRRFEYSISETKLILVLKDLKLELITNGFDFENQLLFFDNLNLKDKFVAIL